MNLAEKSAPMMPSLISPKMSRRKVYAYLWSRGDTKSSPRAVQQMCSIQRLGWKQRWEQWWASSSWTSTEEGV